MNTPINGNDLLALGYTEGTILGIALKINRGRNGFNREQMLQQYTAILAAPETYLDHKIFSKLAVAMIEKANEKPEDFIQLNDRPAAFSAYGLEQIEEGAIKQMQVAMQLPVTVAGALMPDAHQGYGLPIGGVLATKNAIIPYGVGVDIGCRMALSIYDIKEEFYFENEHKFKRELVAHSKFGAGHGFTGQYKSQHAVLENPDFNLIPFVKNLKDKAWSQLGSSGGGNHFVEFGILEFEKDDAVLNIPKGKYVALLTHSGSRGFGATVAGHYTKLAKDVCKLPDAAKNLAYLDMSTELGQEYWIAMDFDFNLPFPDEEFDAEYFYKDVIGVTVNEGLRAETIQLWLDADNAPYVVTKPFHASQVIEQHNDDGSIVISLKLKVNYEFERLVLGFGNALKVIEPQHFRRRIMKRLEAALHNYGNHT